MPYLALREKQSLSRFTTIGCFGPIWALDVWSEQAENDDERDDADTISRLASKQWPRLKQSFRVNQNNQYAKRHNHQKSKHERSWWSNDILSDSIRYC